VTGPLAGAVPSPNIWDFPEIYEAENRAVDPDGVIWAAIAELVEDRGLWGAADWGEVLDIGCGNGFHLPHLADRARHVTGVEPHAGLAAAAARRVAGRTNMTVRQGTAQALPVPNSSMDLVHARWAYFFGPGCEPGLRELERVLRRGGLAVVLDHDGTRSEVGRWFAAGLVADGSRYEPEALELFWGRHGFARRQLDIRWHFDSRAALAAVLGIEFRASVVASALQEIAERGDGWDVSAAVNLWFRRY
jgi:SAM-dependent methyltransferase